MSRPQTWLAAGGALALLAASFGAGFIIAERRLGGGAARTTGGARSAAAKNREATIRFSASGGDGRSAPQKETGKIEPSFYEKLLDKKEPDGSKLEPLKLRNEPAPKKPAAAPAPKSPAPSPNGSAPGLAGRPGPPEKPAPEKSGRTPARAERTGGRYTIQVVSVREPARAIRILRGLRDKGFSAFIQRVELREQGAWLRVRVGRFPDRESANRVLQSLRAKTSVRGGQIVPL